MSPVSPSVEYNFFSGADAFSFSGDVVLVVDVVGAYGLLPSNHPGRLIVTQGTSVRFAFLETKSPHGMVMMLMAKVSRSSLIAYIRLQNRRPHPCLGPHLLFWALPS